MKKVAIIGANSYIGDSFFKHCQATFKIDIIDAKNDIWKTSDLSKYDSVLFVAGIAHVSQDSKMDELYYKINRDLAVEVATSAKSQGVKQFIFMSSMIIYGKDGKVGKKKVIISGDEYAPDQAYGKSKLAADIAIQKMISDSYKPVIIRTPVVYGNGCKGNFSKLLNAGKKMIVFPRIKNERSMIYIKNLCEFFKLIIQNDSCGVFYPQNSEYVSTSEVVKISSEIYGRKLWCTRLAYPIIWLASKFLGGINKVFGNKTYDKTLSQTFNNGYNIVDFETSLRECLEVKEIEK